MSKKFDLDAFKAFVASKPADKAYPITTGRCALAQFGFPGVASVNLHKYGIGTEIYHAAIWDGPIAACDADYYTFGALADRLAATNPLQ